MKKKIISIHYSLSEKPKITIKLNNVFLKSNFNLQFLVRYIRAILKSTQANCIFKISQFANSLLLTF